MKRVLRALVVPVAVVLAVLTVPSVAHADAGVPPMCANFGADPDHCLNPHNRAFFNGNTIDVTPANYNIIEFQIGTVVASGGGCGPFNCGSGCNNRYAGKPVVELIWNANTSFGVRDYTADNDQVEISSTFDDRAWWVQSGGWFINVGATNHAGVNCNTGQPMILTYRPNTGTVWSRCGGCWDAARQNWGFF